MKFSRFIVLVLLSGILANSNGYTQPLVPRKCYLHLLGSVGEFPLVMNLIKNNDTVFGECFFPGKTDGLGIFSRSYQGNLLPLSGKVSNDGSFRIVITAEDFNMILKGHFISGQEIRGTYEAEGALKNLSFQLSESYPQGSLPLNAYFLKGSVSLVKKKNSPEGKIQLSLMLPGESANPVLSDSLKRLMIGKYTDKEVTGSDPDKILNAIAQVFYDTYVSSNIDIYDKTSGQSFDWELLNYMHIVQNSANILGFYIEQYAFTGGANGLQTRKYFSVNLKTGKEILLEELFHKSYGEKLSRLLTTKVREMFLIPSDKLLTEAGFFTDEVLPNSNFYLTPKGIGFFYNRYDIAPRATGSIEIFLEFDELKDCIYSDGVLEEFMN